ncbi:hypothetical protein ACVGWV_03175, partial [Enterobacter asburiae]
GLGNVIGSTILAYFWDDLSPALATNWDKVNMLSTFGPIGGLLVTYAQLLFAFLLVVAQEKRFFISLIHISEPTRHTCSSCMPSSA